MLNNKKTLLFVSFILCLLLLPLLNPLINDASCKDQLNKLTHLKLPNGSQIIKEYSYITSNRGDCVCFTGISLATDMSLKLLTKKINEAIASNSYTIDLVWKSPLGDSLIWMPQDMALQQFPVTTNWSFYGSDIETGIDYLLKTMEQSETNYKHKVILFTTQENSNLFDYRCY